MGSWAPLLPSLIAGLALLGCGAAPDAPLYEHGDARYALSVEPADGALVVRVTPRGRWKMAPAYPVELRCGGLVQAASDAEQLDAASLVFRIATVPDSATTLDASAKFGVCVGEHCEPVEHAFRVAGHRPQH